MSDRCIVVGVTPRQPPTVVNAAARLARAFGVRLVCAHVDPGRYVIEEHPDGSVETRPLDSDVDEWTTAAVDPALDERIAGWTRDQQVEVTLLELAGDVAHALGRLAEVLDAELIVVGSRRAGIRSGMHEFLGGSVAVHLAHRQSRPVVVVPLEPHADGPLPWERH